jgi:hypothetical protein
MPNAKEPNQNGSLGSPEPVRKFPDYSHCLVRRSAMKNSLICLVADPSGCEFAERHASDTFCIHPQWWEILARSEAS